MTSIETLHAVLLAIVLPTAVLALTVNSVVVIAWVWRRLR
jgi:hypothetical protein